MLAGKVEETPKKCRDIIRTARELLPPELFATFGNDPRVFVPRFPKPLSKTKILTSDLFLGGSNDVRESASQDH